MKFIKKFTKVIAMVLVLTTLFSMTVFADSSNSACFDFEKTELYLAKGDVYKFHLYISDWGERREEFPTYSVYVVGKQSKNTYVWGNFKTGYDDLEIHIGEDETAKDFTLYFYVDGIELYDNVNVHIVDPINSDCEATRKAATYKMMGVDPKAKK